MAPRFGHRSRVGLRPAMPVKWAGTRMLPPTSVPTPRGDIPAAMAAASPPDEPPGEWAELQGFTVWPKRGFLVSW